MDRYRRQTAAAAFVIGLFFQTLAYLAGLGKFGLPRDNNLYLMFFTWIHFFVLGMCITPESLEKLCRRAGKLLSLTAVLFALSAVLVTLEGRAMGSYESGMRPWFFVYAPLALLLFLGLGTYLMRLTPLNTCVMHMSAISMDVYFIHVLVLMYLRRFPVFLAGTRGMLLLFMAVSVISFLAAAMISAAKKLCLRLLRPGHIKG